METLNGIVTNPEFVAGVANCAMALLWIYLFYRLTSISRNAFLFVAEVGVVLWLIYSIFIFNKDTKLSKMVDVAVLKPLDRIDVEEKSRTAVDSLTTAFSWVFSKATVASQ